MYQAKRVKVAVSIRGILILCAITFFAACQGMDDSAPASQPQSAIPDTPEADRERLLSRATEYWQARVRHDAPTAYQYEHPVRRKQIQERVYLAAMKPNIDILEFSIPDFELDPEAHDVSIAVQLRYEYTFPQPGVKPILVPTQVIDYWEKDQGIWYHVLDTDVLSRGKPVISRKKTPQQQNEDQNASDSGKTDE